MKNLIFFLLLSLISLNITNGQIGNDFHESRIIAKLTNKSMLIDNSGKIHFQHHPALKRLNQKYNLTEIRILNLSHGKDIITLSFANSPNINQIIRDYTILDIFEYVEPDYIGRAGGEEVSLKPNDAFYNRQWSHYNDGSFNLYPSKHGADAKMEEAWEITQGSEDITVAILDSGILFSNGELTGRFWENSDESSGSADMDGNGYAGDYQGWDFVNGDNNPKDDHGHGTNVAGIFGAQGNNAIGYAGVDWNAKLMILKILDESNSGYYSNWVEAIYYAISNGADVLNMSVGGSGFSLAMKNAIDEAYESNIPVITCMMNENNEVQYYPAAYDATIAVGSTNPDDTRSDSFPWNTSKGSNYGNHIDISGPGNYIYGLSYNNDSNFGTYWSGTSQAAPLVTGTVSLMLSLNPNLQIEDIRAKLRSSADDQVGRSTEDLEGWDKYHGSGRLNAQNALLDLNTSVQNINIENQYVIFGNPIKNRNNLVLGFTDSSYKSIRILSTSGSLIYEYTSTKNLFEINASVFSSGIYFIQVMQEGKNYSTRKFIVF